MGQGIVAECSRPVWLPYHPTYYTHQKTAISSSCLQDLTGPGHKKLHPHMSKARSKEITRREGWLSLQGTSGLSRPVRTQLSDKNISIFGNSSVTPSHQIAPQSSSVASLVGYRSVITPHPKLANTASTEGLQAVVCEAVAHDLLFSQYEPQSYDAIALSTPVPEVAEFISTYCDLLLTRRLEGATNSDAAEWYPLVSSRVAKYTLAVLHFTGIVLNSVALSAVLKMVSALDSLDAQQAEQLKVAAAKAQDAAQERFKHALSSKAPLQPPAFGGNNDSASTDEASSSPWSQKLHKLAQSGAGLPPSLLLEKGFSEEFVDQTAIFHRKFWRNWNPLHDFSLLFHTPQNCSRWKSNPLVFDTENPHFLSVLVAQHVFNTHIPESQRARLVEKWIEIGFNLKMQGDIVGWTAIVVVLFDISCLRLTSLWNLVDPSYDARYAHDWGYENFEIRKRAGLSFLQKNAFRTTTDLIGIRYSKLDFVPYFVDSHVREGGNGDTSLVAKQLVRVSSVTSSWSSYVTSLHDNAFRPISTKEDPAYQHLMAAWIQKPASQIDLMALSLAIQPKLMGYYLPNFYQQILPLTSGAMLPVLFTASVPTFRLFPRATLMMATLPKQASKPNTLKRSSSFPPATPPQTTGVMELDSGAREQLENTASAHVLARVIRDLLNVGTETCDTRTGIVFKSFEAEEFSHRSSRTSSIIETINRRASYRQSSLGPFNSNTASNTDHGAIVSVKSATLVRLVDVMILGAGVFANNNFTLDTDSHIEILLATYRSFCSPAEMLDMLQLRVKCARGAARRLSHMSSVSDIDHIWQPSTAENEVDQWAVKILSNITKTMRTWVYEYFFDFSDDKFVMTAGKTLLNTLTEEIKSTKGYPESLVYEISKLNGAFLRHQFNITKNINRDPSWLKRIGRDNGAGGGSSTAGERGNRWQKIVELPVTSLERDGGLGEINEMVDEIDSIVSDAFSRITLVDWMKLFEVLEQQASKRTGLFSYAVSPYTSESDVIVQDVFSWLGSLQSSSTNTRVLDTLPQSIASLVRLHCSLITYFGDQIADTTLAHAHERRERMVMLLKMLGILRTRMRFLNLSSDIDTDQQDGQHIPSFLERALVSAILLPESRAYANSWLAAGNEVAKMFPGNATSLPIHPHQSTQRHGHGHHGHGHGHHSVLGSSHHGSSSEPTPNSKSIFIPLIPPTSGKPVTLCPGWIVERLLEIVCCVPNISIENPNLINFDKRRYAYNLVKNMCGELQPSSPTVASEAVLDKYDFLFGDVAEMGTVPVPLIDRKVHKESVNREGKSRYRVFTDTISQELDKAKAESKQFDRLERASASSSHGPSSSQSFYGLPVSQSSTSLYSKRISRLIPSGSTTDVSSYLENNGGSTFPSSDTASVHTNNTSAGTVNAKRSQPGAKKSRLGGFFKAVRPLSVLGGYSSHGSQISTPVPAPSSGSSFYKHPHGSNQSFQEEGQYQPFQPYQQQHQQHQQHQQQQQNQASIQQQHNNTADYQQPYQATQAAKEVWLNDGLINLTALPQFSECNPDDWQSLYSIELINIYTVELNSLNVISITFRSGKESENILLRGASNEDAQEWVRQVDAAKKKCLMDTTKVFGIPLEIVCAKEKRNVPAFLETLLTQIEDRGLTEVGIYRISGSIGAVKSMKDWFDSGNSGYKKDDPKWYDINAVAGCVKLYLRELPESLMTDRLLPEFFKAVNGNNVDLQQVHSTLSQLPRPNYYVLRRLTYHLRLIVDNSAENKMNVHNVSIVFGVNFLPPVVMKQMGIMQNLVKAMVEEYDKLFTI